MNVVEALKDLIKKVEDEEQVDVDESETVNKECEEKEEDETVEKADEETTEEEVVEDEIMTLDDLVKDLADNDSFKLLIKSLLTELMEEEAKNEEVKKSEEEKDDEVKTEKSCKVNKSRTTKINLSNDRIVETKYDLYKATGRDMNGVKIE